MFEAWHPGQLVDRGLAGWAAFVHRLVRDGTRGQGIFARGPFSALRVLHALLSSCVERCPLGENPRDGRNDDGGDRRHGGYPRRYVTPLDMGQVVPKPSHETHDGDLCVARLGGTPSCSSAEA
jgi:hypothetical protein